MNYFQGDAPEGVQGARGFAPFKPPARGFRGLAPVKNPFPIKGFGKGGERERGDNRFA